MAQTFVVKLICANCQEPAKAACEGCRLVLYCGKDCQTKHRTEHIAICESPLRKATWVPDSWYIDILGDAMMPVTSNPPTWLATMIKNVNPLTFRPSTIAKSQFGQQFLWGNMPAIDVLKLRDNEGEECQKDISLLFAASGDCRNVIKTIVELPDKYASKLSVVINDLDFDVCARNAILLLIPLVAKDEAEAVDGMIHVWYSSFITKKHIHLLNSIRSIINGVCGDIKDSSSVTEITKVFQFGTKSVQITLKKSAWIALRGMVSLSAELSRDRAKYIRTAGVLDENFIGLRQRRMRCQQPSSRVCELLFVKTGILLPVGWSQDEYNIPNPTLFRNNEWHIVGNSNPIEGWCKADVLNVDVGPAGNDVTAKLYVYLQAMLGSFYRRLCASNIEFSLLNVDVTDLSAAIRKLPVYVDGRKFARIETTNIADTIYLGIEGTLIHLMPLLESANENPHATLITCFMNTVDNMVDRLQNANTRAEIISWGYRGSIEQTLNVERSLVRKFLGNREATDGLVDMALDHVRDGTPFFDAYARSNHFEQHVVCPGWKMKNPHTIVEQWPLKMKKSLGEPGAQEEFDALFSSEYKGTERYVEWYKIAEGPEHVLELLGKIFTGGEQARLAKLDIAYRELGGQ